MGEGRNGPVQHLGGLGVGKLQAFQQDEGRFFLAGQAIQAPGKGTPIRACGRQAGIFQDDLPQQFQAEIGPALCQRLNRWFTAAAISPAARPSLPAR